MSVRGALNHHVHVYPHAAGGAFENLERKLYEIRMTCPFLQRLAKYPGLWPTKLATLRTQFETGEAGRLTIPTVGTITARCLSWPEEMDAKIQSGVMVELEFIEDQSQLNLVETLIATASANVEDAASAYADVLADYKADATAGFPPSASSATVLSAAQKSTLLSLDLLDTISSVANDVFALKDQADLESSIFIAKIDRLSAIIQEADRTVVELQKPERYSLLDALRNLWTANRQLQKDLQGRSSPLETFIVPMTMSVTDVSAAIYGDNSHAVELMQLNALDDPLSIPAGTRVKYYLPTAA